MSRDRQVVGAQGSGLTGQVKDFVLLLAVCPVAMVAVIRASVVAHAWLRIVFPVNLQLTGSAIQSSFFAAPFAAKHHFEPGHLME